MQVKLGQILNSVETIRKLTAAELPLKLSFRLVSLVKQLDEHLKVFEELRAALIRKYGEEIEGGAIQVKPENIETFSIEMNEALQEEVSVAFEKIHIDSFPDSVTLTASEMMTVDWLLEI